VFTVLLSIQINCEEIPSWAVLRAGGEKCPLTVVCDCDTRDLAVYSRRRTARETVHGTAYVLAMLAALVAMGFGCWVNFDAGDVLTGSLGIFLMGVLATCTARFGLGLFRPRVWLRVPLSVAPHLGLYPAAPGSDGGGA
jgi:hypothetical protein